MPLQPVQRWGTLCLCIAIMIECEMRKIFSECAVLCTIACLWLFCVVSNDEPPPIPIDSITNTGFIQFSLFSVTYSVDQSKSTGYPVMTTIRRLFSIWSADNSSTISLLHLHSSERFPIGSFAIALYHRKRYQNKHKIEFQFQWNKLSSDSMAHGIHSPWNLTRASRTIQTPNAPTIF